MRRDLRTAAGMALAIFLTVVTIWCAAPYVKAQEPDYIGGSVQSPDSLPIRMVPSDDQGDPWVMPMGRLYETTPPEPCPAFTPQELLPILKAIAHYVPTDPNPVDRRTYMDYPIVYIDTRTRAQKLRDQADKVEQDAKDTSSFHRLVACVEALAR